MKQCFLLLLAIAFSFTSSPAEDAKPANASAPKLYSITVNYITPDGKNSSSSSLSNLTSLNATIPITVNGGTMWVVSTSQPGDDKREVSLNILDVTNLSQTIPPLTILNGFFLFKIGKELTVLKTPNYSVSLSIAESADEKK